ncbi:MAG: carbon-nitrogen hydrolase family protein [Polyangiaceae bacterium]
MPPRTLKICTTQYPIDPVETREDWIAKTEHWIERAHSTGAELVVFPEYAGLELAHTIPDFTSLTPLEQLQALQPLVALHVDVHERLSRKYETWILAGSLPERVTTGYRNRARFYGPSGLAAICEKCILTPFERQWGLTPGDEVSVIETPIGTIGVAICYDSEFPLLVRSMVDRGVDLVLVPSCTDGLAGAQRVKIACQARALENQCYVVQASTVGVAPRIPAVDENHGIAAAYCPPDVGFPESGILAAGALDCAEWVFADLDFFRLAEVRSKGQVRNCEDWSLQNLLTSRTRTIIVD